MRKITSVSALESVVGQIIRQIREGQGLTQRELGYLTGLDPMTISRIERGIRLPSLGSIFLIAKALQIEASRLVQRVEDLEPDIILQEPPGGNYRKRGRARKSVRP